MTPNNLSEPAIFKALSQPFLEVKVVRKVPKGIHDNNYVMSVSPSNNILFINRNELPEADDVAANEILKSKYFIFLLINFIHEVVHLFTRDLNDLSGNTNSKTADKKFETPEKVGRATYGNETDKDCGGAMEICLFGGVFFFEDEHLTVTVFSDPEIDINGNGRNSTTYLVSDEKALYMYAQLAQWFDNDEEVSSVVTILSCLHYSELQIFQRPTSPALFEGLRSKRFHVRGTEALPGDRNSTLPPRGLIEKKLFASHFFGEKT